MQEESKEKSKDAPFESLRILSERWKNGTFSEIIDDWKWIFGYSARYKGAIVFYTILGILSTSLGLVGSVAGKYLIDIITGYQIQKLPLLLCIMIGSTVFSLGFESVINRISTKLGIAINNDIQADIFDKIVDADWLEISKYANGDVLNRFNGDIGTVSGNGIRQICDMVQMIRIYGRKIDWEMFWQLCEEYHMTCFCINLLDIGERYLGFSYEASGAVRAAKKLHPDSEALLIDILDAGSFGKSSAGRIHSANITLYAAETGMEKHTAGGIWKSLVPEASYMKNKYPYAARYPFLLPAAYVQRILKWLGQGEKEQKSSIEVGAGRVELLKKYDMIRTADGKKRGDAHAGRIQREK